MGDGGSEIDGRGRLAHAAFLIGNREDGRHRTPALEQQDVDLPVLATGPQDVGGRLPKPTGAQNVLARAAGAQAKNVIPRPPGSG